MNKQIIAIGGGGFGRNPNHRLIENYILKQSDKETPNILFIPTASAEDKSYIVNFYACFSKLNCRPRHLNLFERTPRLEGLFNKSDIIYVGGGNTKSMLAVWREWKIDKLLLKAYNQGTILSGVSAGAICWFDKGVTDSWASNLILLDCLGFLEGNCCPHYNSEKERRPSVQNFIEKRKLESIYAIDDGAAVHFINGEVHKNIRFFDDANVYLVDYKEDQIRHANQSMFSLL